MFELLETHSSLGPGAQVMFKHKRRKMAAVSRFFNVPMNTIFRFLGMSFFIFVSAFRLKFLRIGVSRKRLQSTSKTDLNMNALTLGFLLLEYGFFVDFISMWTQICKSCSKLFLFRRHRVFPINSLRGLLVGYLNVPAVFRHRIFLSRLNGFINATQPYLLCFLCLLA